MKTVNFYTKDMCGLCEKAEALLYMFQQDFPFKIEVRDIHTNDNWLETYQLRIPVIEIDDQRIDCEKMGYDNVKTFLNRHL